MNKTILYIEDDADDRQLLSSTIEDNNPGVKVVCAENGLQALEYLHAKKEEEALPCLIVLDLNMPFIDGKETYRRIKSELKIDSIPVIIFTSSRNPNDQELFSNLGVQFITKPHTFSLMNKVVGQMLSLCS